jgi:hypothetical protein
MAIPDGDDLLLAVMASGKGHHCGVARWVRRADGWCFAAFAPVPEAEGLMEPTLARDSDGALLFTVRMGDRMPDEAYALRIWRSEDAGANWEKVVNVPETLDAGPRGVGTAVDGTPFVLGNPVRLDRSYFREALSLWPLNTARDGVEPPIVVRDGPAEFGEAPKQYPWRVDHANTAVLRLSDGQWRCVLALRLYRNDLLTAEGAPEAVVNASGLYLEEIQSSGPVRS